MSVTTTPNARLNTARHYLADYELYHSQPSQPSPAPAPNTHLALNEAQTSSNPTDWETNWRRVPAYRPAVNQVDEQRNTYTSEVERNFVRVMFGGEYNTLWQRGGIGEEKVISWVSRIRLLTCDLYAVCRCVYDGFCEPDLESDGRKVE